MKLISASLAGLTIAGTAFAFAQSPSTNAAPVTLVGTVVDAACYMIHPDAATIPTHKDCGAACIARGVPLAIANEADKTLYFPADGNTQLLPLLDARVRVTGTAVEKKEPMELKMPVGEKNQMAVRVDGGYKVVTIGKIVREPGRPRK
jgi:hypothetical protein